jgi:hypothetical protein
MKEGSLDMNGTGSQPGTTDSIYWDTTNYWAPVTCARVTDTINEDGTHTTVYDYGVGCDEYGSLTKGKITYIWKEENNSYYSEVIYDHYYSYGVEMNGNSRYTFTSDGNSYYSSGSKENYGDSTVTIMPIIFNWSGTSTGHDDVTMIYDDGNTTTYKSDYSNVWDSVSYKVLEGDYYYSSTAEDYVYHYKVSEPLITDYRCTNAWVPVSGIETITTVEKGQTDEYSLNYGNGTCDNLAELTQNGETSIIDFGEIYKAVEGNDSTVVSPAGRKGRR